MDSLNGISAASLAALTGMHISSARRWLRHQPPPWLRRLAAVYLEGQLGEIDCAWRGWRLLRGELISPEGDAFTPGAVRAGRLYESSHHELRRRQLAAAHAIDQDADRQRHLEALTLLQSAAAAADRALELLSEQLSPREAQRLFAEHPRTQMAVARWCEFSEAMANIAKSTTQSPRGSNKHAIPG